jgi:hypothetical protein
MIEYLKEGFHLANRNLHLVFIRIAATIINIIGLIVCFGLPLVVAVTYLSFDIAHAVNLLPYFMEKPYEFLSRYFGLIFFLGISIILYLLFVTIIIIYSLGGILGVLRDSAVSAQYTFSLSSFFREANRNFSRLFWLISLESFVFTILFIALLAAGAAVAGFPGGFSRAETLPEIFFSSFALMSVVVLSIIVLVISLAIMIISITVSTVEGAGAADTLRKTFDFLKKNPAAFFFTVILFAGVTAAHIGFVAVRVFYGVAPLFIFGGIILSIISAVLQNYLAVIAWGCMVAYYIRATNYSSSARSYEI